MEFPRSRILVFAKAPVPGRVKTRLARVYGARGAARLYRQVLWRTLTTAAGAGLAPLELWCAPDPDHRFFSACRRRLDVELKTQCDGDLGRRMHHALSAGLHARDAAVLIGADAASLGAGELRAALGALAAGADAALGPTEDGGYLLIGLRRPCPALFEDMPWSTPQVLAITRGRLRRLGLQVCELPQGWDLDRPADVRRWQALYPRRTSPDAGAASISNSSSDTNPKSVPKPS